MPFIGPGLDNGFRKRNIYTATAGQTSFSGSDANGITLSYTDTEYLDVYQNGVLLVPGDDYAATTGTSVVLVQGASLNDKVEMINYQAFGVADTVSRADGGTFSGNISSPIVTASTSVKTPLIEFTDGDDAITIADGGGVTLSSSLTGTNATFTTADNTDTLTLISTDADANKGPCLVLQRDSSSAADGDVTGFIEFKADNDAAEATSIGEIKMHFSDVSDSTEDSELNIRTITAGSMQNRLKINSDECAVNEGSTSADFRVESDSMSHQLHMNGSNGKFTINANSAQSPASHFTLFFAAASYSAFAAQETDGGSGAGFFIARKSDGSTLGQIKRNGTADEIQYVTTSDYRLKENVNYDFDATTTLKKLKPCEFNWISDEKNTTITGFLAHEVQEVYPHATSGEKDAMETYTDSDGKEQTRVEAQGIEKSDLVPLLVKSLQEALTEIDTLKTKVAALESS